MRSPSRSPYQKRYSREEPDRGRAAGYGGPRAKPEASAAAQFDRASSGPAEHTRLVVNVVKTNSTRRAYN